MNRLTRVSLCMVFLSSLAGTGAVQAQQTMPAPATSTSVESLKQPLQPGNKANDKAAAKNEAEEEGESKPQAFDAMVKGYERLEGLFTLYRNRETGKLLMEIKPEQLNQNFLFAATMESGIGEAGIYRGMPLRDFLFYFQRVNRELHFVVRNVNFRTEVNDPQQRSLNRSFTDSVLYALKVKSIHPQRKTLLVDLGPMLLSDLPGLSPWLSQVLGSGYSLDASKSYFNTAKAFPQNLEVESVYGFAAGDDASAYSSPTLPDSRALTIRVHYSLSQLPVNHGYRPRLADDRVGYFVTTHRDFSISDRPDPHVRYITRWHLEKQDPTAPLSPPKKPIVFWIENTVPLEYRDVIREGVLMWNRAFEQAGFKDAIEVRQMPDNATWDPADVRYNTIRWFNSVDAYFAMGPSRINPLTGEILDADIVIDANYVRYGQQQYLALVEQNQARKHSSWSARGAGVCGILERFANRDRKPTAKQSVSSFQARSWWHHGSCYAHEATNQLAFGALAQSLLSNTPSGNKQEFLRQFLRETIAHEIGHTLGLSHNFHGSTSLAPQELNQPEVTRARGLTASVMDYNAANLAPKGTPQGEYYTSLVGPYDSWAIEYGYTPSNALHPQAERALLQKIVRRADTDPLLSFGNDEDAMAFLDPEIDLFDLSSNSLVYSQWQMDNAREMWERLDQRYPSRGDSISEVRQMFNVIFSYYFRNAVSLNLYVAGQSIHRSSTSATRLPLEPVNIEKQRQALALLQQYVFDENAFRFSPELLGKLVPARWLDWTDAQTRLDYPIYENIFFLQSVVLTDLLSSERLSRLRDNELRAKPGQALMLPELFDTLQSGIWKEVLRPDGKMIKLSSLRRALQRQYMDLLIQMVLRTGDVPEDARTLAWYNLKQLRSSLDSVLRKQGGEIDTYTKAHLEESRTRIAKALDAPLQSQ